MPRAYYNENDPFAAAWLRSLIAAGWIMDGEVDDRSITEVSPQDLRGFNTCHFFAGVGGWELALSMAGVPEDVEVWTGSCPCQPLSSAGKGKGDADERHLWPAFHALVSERRPRLCFGEQVASKLGREWMSAVRADLEHVGYACGVSDLPAAGGGAPHIRQRLWWVAHHQGGLGGMGDHNGRGSPKGDAPSPGSRPGSSAQPAGGGMGDPDSKGSQRRSSERPGPDQRLARAASLADPWTGCDYIQCRDGKARPVKPGIFPLAHGIPARVGRIRGYGNAIVPQVASVFIRSALEAISDIQA